MPTPTPTIHTTGLRITAIVCAALMASHAVQAAPPTDPNLLKQLRPGFVEGYLPSGTWVDSLALLPPPPAAGSPAHAADDAVFQLSRTLKDSPRWLQAEKDSVLAFPKAPQAFQCALGITISAEATPHLNMLMRRTLADEKKLGLSGMYLPPNVRSMYSRAMLRASPLMCVYCVDTGSSWSRCNEIFEWHQRRAGRRRRRWRLRLSRL